MTCYTTSMFDSFESTMSDVAKCFELLGVVILVIGMAYAFGRAGRDFLRGERAGLYPQVRASVGHSILLGLEVLVAADLIRTVAVDPSIENVAVLGVIVLIRTFLSLSLDIEIEGRPPWRARTPTPES